MQNNALHRYIPTGSVKVADKLSDAVAYVSQREMPNGTAYYAIVYFGKQSKAFIHRSYRTASRREADVKAAFASRQASQRFKDSLKTKRAEGAEAFQAQIAVGDIFHSQFGYDETHHEFHEVVELRGKHALVKEITQERKDLGYDYRYSTKPVAGSYATGKPIRVLIQNGYIKVDGRHASKWTGREYTGGGSH